MTDAQKIDALIDLCSNVIHSLEMTQYHIEDISEAANVIREANHYDQQMLNILHSGDSWGSGTRPRPDPCLTPYNSSMKNTQKHEIRLFILTQLLEMDDLRWKLHEVADTYDIDSLEAMEFFEQEVERINKLFNYPAEQLKETV